MFSIWTTWQKWNFGSQLLPFTYYFIPRNARHEFARLALISVKRIFAGISRRLYAWKSLGYPLRVKSLREPTREHSISYPILSNWYRLHSGGGFIRLSFTFNFLVGLPLNDPNYKIVYHLDKGRKGMLCCVLTDLCLQCIATGDQTIWAAK